MAILDWEGFDRETANLGMFNEYSTNPTNDGTGAFNYGRAKGDTCARYTAFPSTQTLFIQFHFYYAVSNMNASVGLLDGNTWQIYFYIANDHIPTIRHGNGTTLASGTQAIAIGTWHFVQLKVTIANSGGTAELRINGKSIASYTGDTQNTANASANGWKINTSSGNWVLVDNLLIYDTVGDAPTTWTPETRILETLPNGAGFTTEWTPSAGSNWQCVDEQPSNGDTDYVSAATAPLSDLYAVPASAIAGGIIYGLAVHATVRKDDAGASEVDGLIRSGGTTYAKGSPFVVTSNYVRARWLWSLDPATAAAWTVAGANAAQPGIRRTT